MARSKNALEVQDLGDSSIDQQAMSGAMLAMREQGTQVATLAEQIGYDGSLTVGALEDGIRFYQRRSVEALLEVGKRLLLLKEITPHGEFSERVDMLGISDRTARRFMQAAAKTAKSATVAVLADKVKNQKAFLELVTHDDDADLERLAEMDDIDRMSASQVRAALRESRAEHDATKAVMSKKQARIDQLERAQERIAKMPPDEDLEKLQQEATTHLLAAQGAIRGQLRAALVALHNHAEDNGAFMAGMVAQLMADLTVLRDEFNLQGITDDGVPDWQKWAAHQSAAPSEQAPA